MEKKSVDARGVHVVLHASQTASALVSAHAGSGLVHAGSGLVARISDSQRFS